MASRSVPGMHGWGNLYAPLLRGAHRLSLCHGGGLWAPFLFDRGVAGMVDSQRGLNPLPARWRTLVEGLVEATR
jgi:hypothetical protein